MRSSNLICCRGLFALVSSILIGGCAEYGPYHGNISGEPLNSVRGPSDGRYKFAFIEFGDQGSALDTSQRAAAINVIRQAQRPLLFVYIHGWMNDANSGDVCRFEHFIDMISRLPEVTQGNINVIGVYIAWRGKNLTVPGLDLLTFWNRKLAGGDVAAQNSCLATINELALAAREPGKKVHHCVLMGHSFGGLVLSNTISHSILDASSTGARNASPWDMAVAFNAADNSIGTRQLMPAMFIRPARLRDFDPRRLCGQDARGRRRCCDKGRPSLPHRLAIGERSGDREIFSDWAGSRKHCKSSLSLRQGSGAWWRWKKSIGERVPDPHTRQR